MGSSDISSFVKEKWIEFETAIRMIIANELGVEDGKDGVLIKQTEPSNDGGYDGLFCIPLSDSPVGEVYKLLFEAKLRSNLKADLPLDSFSKAIIVAINRDANALIVGTNLYLSPETKRRLDDFSKRTGLCIDYIEGINMEVWIAGHPEQSDISIFAKVLKESKASDEDKSLLSVMKKNIEDARLCSGIIGTKRNNDFRSALSELVEHRHSIIVKGSRGTGKSYFINCLINSLSDNTTCIRLDLSILHIPRTVFSTIISEIWGIEESLILSLETDELYDAISMIGDNEIDKRICDSVIDVLSKTDNEYTEKASIFNHQLILFLTDLLNVATKRRFVLMYVSNSDVASTEMLEFIAALKSSLSDYVPFVIEIRSGFNSPVSSGEWIRYTNNLCSDYSKTNVYVLENWDKKDAKTYISKSIKYLDDVGVNFILRQTDANPIMICSYLNYLNSTRLLEGVSPSLHETKLKDLYIDDVTDIIQCLIESVCKSSEESGDLSAKCLILLSFSGGSLEKACVEEVLGCKVGEIRLIFSAEVVLLSGEKLHIRHLIYQEVLEKIQHKLMDTSDIFMLAEKLHDYLEHSKLKDDSWYMTMIKVCEYLNNNDEKLEYILEFSKELFEKGQYHLCRDVLEKLDFTGVKNVLISYNADMIDAFEMLLNLDFYLKERDADEIAGDIKQLESLIKKLKMMPEIDERKRDQICRCYLIIAKYRHSIGCFTEALSTMKDAKNVIEVNSEIPDNHTVYEVYMEYAIAVKETDGLDAYIESLENSLKKYPLVYMFRFLLNSAKYQKAYIFSPKEAKKYVEDTDDFRRFLAIPDIIHNDVHKANVFFHLKEYETAREYAKEYSQLAREYGLINEIGRLENIIGCTYLAPENMDTTMAIKHLEYGMEIYKNSTYYSFYWPILYNYTILCDHIGDKAEVLSHIVELCDVLRRYGNLLNKGDIVSKHYVAYICVLRILKKMYKKEATKDIADTCTKELIKGISRCDIYEYANTPQKRFPSKKLSKTTFHHGKLYLITY